MEWRIDLAMLESNMARALEELRKARAELELTQGYSTATSEWWCRQVHLAREKERRAVIDYLEASGLQGAARDIRNGEHEEL
ncbi:MAG: hypothetical protein RIT24_254 [Planctomycetota bacterium]|jgi:hypothetical protein